MPRLRVGDSVKIVGSLLANKNDPGNKDGNNNMPNNNNNNNNPFESCKDLTIIDIRTSPSFAYIVQVGKTPCGMQQFVVEQGMAKRIHQFPSGMQILVEMDEESVIERHHRVELRKCRGGGKASEQEFRLEVLPRGKSDEGVGVGANGKYYDVGNGKKKENTNAEVRIIHSPTGLNLASVLGAKMPILELQQVFEHGLFEGSGDYVFVRSIGGKKDNGNDDAFRHFQQHQQQQQQGEGNKASLLASGNFGEKEYSEVEFFPTKRSVGFEEQTFSMWMFKEVEEMREENNESGGTTTSGAAPARPMDEHAEWLERMTHLIGIDYLEELAPWHLLDVERESSKTDVKARFRELSRYFHPDKVSPEKKYVFEKIFVLLQDAYGGLKTADEAEKESFRSKADFDSQLFAHSKYVIELLPFHWTKLTSSSTKGNDGLDGEEEADSTSNNDDTYVLNAASHLNSALFQNVTDPNEEESEPSVQLWVVFKYSSRCSMSRTVEGFIDLAARHLEQYENIKVGAYGCGLYKDFKATKKDVLGLTADPICKQFHRSETPNVHVIVETLPGRKRDENGMMVEVPPDPKLLEENSKFKYFYSGVPDGNVTAFYPHHFIQFAKAGKRIWNNSHLVKKMIWEDFNDASFAENVTIVAFMDGTGEGDTNQEVVDAISNSLPGLARRFLEDGLQVGVASCGYGDEYKNDDDVSDAVDCSKLDVSWLPDVKIYRENDTQGVSLLRGQFGDRRDVQIGM